MSEIDTQTQPPPGRRPRAGYNGGKPLPVIRTLRELRVDADLTMSALERASGVNRAIISQIERGRLVATREELDAIAQAMGLPAGGLEVRTLVVMEGL